MTNYTDEQFEHILDEALALAHAGKSHAEILAMFPVYATELAEILALASNTEQHFVGVRAHSSLREVLKKIPVALPQVEKKSIFDFLFVRPFAVGFTAVVLALGINAAVDNDLQISEKSSTADVSVQAGMAGGDREYYADDSSANMAPQLTSLPTISDVREYIKTTYRATIKTRHVSDIIERLLITIRGYGGRVDSYGSFETGAHIEFVVPKSKFDAFRRDLTELAGDRFITQFENGQNVLWKKISTEDRNETANKAKLEAEQRRATIIKKYSSVTASLTQQISAAQQKINQTEGEERATYVAKKSSLERQRAQQQSQYNRELVTVNQQLSDAADEIENLKKQDQPLSEDVETVSGTIMLQKINWWDVVTTYVPIGWFIAAAILALYYYWKKRRVTQ